jgi:hypothetical protein
MPGQPLELRIDRDDLAGEMETSGRYLDPSHRSRFATFR